MEAATANAQSPTSPQVFRAGELEIRPAEFLAIAGERAAQPHRARDRAADGADRARGADREPRGAVRTVWGEPYRKSDRSVDVYVGKLRQKLERGAARPALHPHPLRLWLPLPGGIPASERAFTSLSHAGDRSITDCPRSRGTLAATNERTKENTHEEASRARRCLAPSRLAWPLAAAMTTRIRQQRRRSGDLSGYVTIDGSSTVGPFAQAAAEQFQGENPGVKISVGTSGTGGGFEKFCAGETDISDASRPIKDDEEVPICKKNGVTYKEVQSWQRRHRHRHQQGPEGRLPHGRPAEEAVEQGLEGQEATPRSIRSSPTPRWRCSARAPTPALRLLHRGDQR